jgi:hypothetical protein
MDATGRQTSTQLSPNPANRVNFPTIGCSAVDTSPKVVFVGSNCALIQPDNGANCYWDNAHQVRLAVFRSHRVLAQRVRHWQALIMHAAATLTAHRPPSRTCARNPPQAFAGSGCVASPTAECACRHLTDFASKPTIVNVTLTAATPPTSGVALQQRPAGGWWWLLVLSCILSAFVVV